MKKCIISILFTSILHLSFSQTWIEKSMNGMRYNNDFPLTNHEATIYSEPIDTTWRLGYTGIGTNFWPKVKLQVHSNDNIESITPIIIGMFGGDYEDYNSIFTNGGKSNRFYTNSILGISSAFEKTNAFNMSILGSTIGSDNTNGTLIGTSGIVIGENNKELFGISGYVNGDNNTNRIAGVIGNGVGNGNFINYGVIGECSSTDPNSVNISVYGRGINNAFSTTNLVNIGVLGNASCNQTSKASQFNCAIFGRNINCTDSTESTNLYPTGSFAGYFDGNVLVTGWLSTLSDRRLKTNNQNVSIVFEKLKNIKVYSFRYKHNVGLSLPNNYKYGVIADEIEKDLPELVQEVNTIIHKEPDNFRNIETYKSVDYYGFMPLLIQAVNELNQKLEDMNPEKTISNLKIYEEQINDI